MSIQKFSRHMRLNGTGLYVPDTGEAAGDPPIDFGYGFDWMPELGGNLPFFAYTANTAAAYTLDGTEVIGVKNFGTAGTDGDLVVPVSANVNGGPQFLASAINGHPGFYFERVNDSNGDALGTPTRAATLAPPYSVMIVYDVDQNSGGVNIWSSGITQYDAGHFINGSHNKSMFNGITRSDTGHPIGVVIARLTFGNGATTDPQYIQQGIVELAAGSTGTNSLNGFTMGGANELYLTPMDGPISAIVVYPGEVWQTTEGLDLYDDWATYYS